jgi:putative Mg2+ transporter-C (MgtC) family protein
MHLAGPDGGVRVIAYVVSGIGFLGAGVIMKQGKDVRGLNTAATLWASAAVGSCAGADMIAQAVALTIFVLAGNTLLRPLVNAINRVPLDEKASEATYYFKLAVTPHALTAMRDRLVEQLEAASYPVADVEVVEIGDGQIEIVATLVPTAVDPNELNAVALDLAEAERRAPRHLGSQHDGLGASIASTDARVVASRILKFLKLPEIFWSSFVLESFIPLNVGILRSVASQ